LEQITINVLFILKNIEIGGNMLEIGIIRKVDSIGRIALPKTIRTSMKIKARDSVEIFVDGNTIILRKYIPGCIFCNEIFNLKNYKKYKICEDCIKEMSNIK